MSMVFSVFYPNSLHGDLDEISRSQTIRNIPNLSGINGISQNGQLAEIRIPRSSEKLRCPRNFPTHNEELIILHPIFAGPNLPKIARDQFTGSGPLPRSLCQSRSLEISTLISSHLTCDLTRSHRDLTPLILPKHLKTHILLPPPNPLHLAKVSFNIQYLYPFIFSTLKDITLSTQNNPLPLLSLLYSLSSLLPFCGRRHVSCVPVDSSIFYMPSPSHLQVAR